MTWGDSRSFAKVENPLDFPELKESESKIIKTVETRISNSQSLNECPYCSLHHTGKCLYAKKFGNFKIITDNYEDSLNIEKLINSKKIWIPISQPQQSYKFAIKWDTTIDISGLNLITTNLKTLKIYKNHEHEILALWKPPTPIMEKNIHADLKFENPISTDYLVLIFEPLNPLNKDFQISRFAFFSNRGRTLVLPRTPSPNLIEKFLKASKTT